jgi:hypothetical protein
VAWTTWDQIQQTVLVSNGLLCYSQNRARNTMYPSIDLGLFIFHISATIAYLEKSGKLQTVIHTLGTKGLHYPRLNRKLVENMVSCLGRQTKTRLKT